MSVCARWKKYSKLSFVLFILLIVNQLVILNVIIKELSTTYLTAFLHKPKNPIIIWKQPAIIRAPCIALIVCTNLYIKKKDPVRLECNKSQMKWKEKPVWSLTTLLSKHEVCLLARTIEVVGIIYAYEPTATEGRRVPNKVWKSVLNPEVKSNVCITLAFSACDI